MTDDELLNELGVEVQVEKKSSRTPEEERIIAGFEDIERFYETHGKLPSHEEEKDIFERIYAVRLERLRSLEQYHELLASFDKYGLLKADGLPEKPITAQMDDDELLSELGISVSDENDITNLKHVRSRNQINMPDEIAKRIPCADFDRFSPLFLAVQNEIKAGIREIREFKDDAKINQGEYFILGGQKAYIAEKGEEFIAEHGRSDSRLRVIYDNGTESDILMRSLQRALNKDELGRRITDPCAGPLFSDEAEPNDIESGTIYVLRSLSENPTVKENREVIHKIGITSNDIQKRIADAKNDPTFLMADVEVVATYKLSNINRIKLENIIHRFFDSARLSIEIPDRFGKKIQPREWFLAPLFIIDKAVEMIKDSSIINHKYDPNTGRIVSN